MVGMLAVLLFLAGALVLSVAASLAIVAWCHFTGREDPTRHWEDEW